MLREPLVEGRRVPWAMQLHKQSTSLIVIPSRATSSLRNYWQAVAISTAYVLKSCFPHDQDHYGGLAATDELARGAQISTGSRVADFYAPWPMRS